MEIVAIALEELVLLYRQHDVEITLGSTGTPGVAFALVTNARSIFHSSRDADTDGVAAVSQPRAVALMTGIGDHLSGAVANGTGAGNGKETLLVTNLSTTGTLFAGFRAAAGRRSTAPAVGTDFSTAELDLHLLAENRLFELQRKIVADVAAALPAPIAA